LLQLLLYLLLLLLLLLLFGRLGWFRRLRLLPSLLKLLLPILLAVWVLPQFLHVSCGENLTPKRAQLDPEEHMPSSIFAVQPAKNNF
jgi:hypothetical protein